MPLMCSTPDEWRAAPHACILLGRISRRAQADTTRFMLACDDCGIWYHGDCVGVSQHTAARCSVWRCPPCARRYDKAQAHSTLYCACRGPWDGRSFMIACDGCEGWFHGACLGVAGVGVREGAEAAFRKFLCPSCTHTQRSPQAGFKSGGWLTGPQRAGSDAVARPSSLLAASSACTDADVAASSPVAASARAPPSSPERACLLLSILSADELSLVISHLPLSSVLISFASASHRLAAIAETHLQAICQANGWRVPRRSRDHPYSWRLLLRARACAVCLGKDAFFPVRRGAAGLSGGSAPLFRLCRECARREKVQHQVQRHGYEIDSIGENGKALHPRQFHIPLFGHANGFDSHLQEKVTKRGL
jgi:hypothetical protein